MAVLVVKLMDNLCLCTIMLLVELEAISLLASSWQLLGFVFVGFFYKKRGAEDKHKSRRWGPATRVPTYAT